MLKKLRTKFICIIMISVTVVLLITMISIVVINYQQSIIFAEEQLSRANDLAASGYINSSQNPFNKTTPPPDIRRQSNDMPDIPIVVYNLKNNGVLQISLAGMSTTELSSDSIYDSIPYIVNSKEGLTINNDIGLVYKKENINSSVYIAVTDIYSVTNWKDLLTTLIPIFVISILIFFIVSLRLSKWALKPVEKSWYQQKQFVEDASHDLKTPISVILANTSILEDNCNKDQQQWVKSTKHESNKMLKMVNDMLDLSRAENIENTKDELTCFSLSDMVEGIQLSFESIAYDNNIKMKTNISKKITVEGSKEDTEKIIETLFTNAFKHASKSDTVSICLKPGEFSINNKKSVIDQNDLQHIFDRFYKTDKSRNDTSSHGLGLAIAKSLSDKNNYNLQCKSNPEKGTTFYLKFKVSKS